MNQTVAETIPPVDFSNLVEAVKNALSEGDPGVRLAGAGLDGKALQESVAGAVADALSISFGDALLKGWYGVKEIRKLTGKDGPMDGKPRVAALAKHKLRITHSPEIRLSLGEAVDLRKLRMPVTLELEIAGVALTVMDRKITKAMAGYIQPKLVIKVEKVKIVDTKLKQVELSDDLLAHPGEAPAEAAATEAASTT